MTDGTVRIDGNTLRLPGGVAVRFIRTLRLPETGTHPLPPGLGEFPVRRVADHADSVPEEWRARRPAFAPGFLREAVWPEFAGRSAAAALPVRAGEASRGCGGPVREPLARRA